METDRATTLRDSVRVWLLEGRCGTLTSGSAASGWSTGSEVAQHSERRGSGAGRREVEGRSAGGVGLSAGRGRRARGETGERGELGRSVESWDARWASARGGSWAELEVDWAGRGKKGKGVGLGLVIYFLFPFLYSFFYFKPT